MALKLLVTAHAKRDAGRILGYIARENPEAAAVLARTIERGVLRLLKFPLSAPVVPNQANPDIRQLIIPPCRILYRATDKTLYVVGVMRCEQNIEDDQFQEL